MTTKSKSAHLTLDLADVRKAGSVEAAILAWCEESDTTCAGVIGSSFSTSGPGSGWSRQHGANDYAARSLTEGALHYLDESDGRLASRETVDLDDEDCDEDGEPTDSHILHDPTDGDYFRIAWSDASVVRIECPYIEDAIEHPAVVAEMAQAVIDHHAAESDRAAWKKLILAIRDAAEAVEDIDADDFDAE